MSFRQPFSGDYPITQRYGEKITSAFHTGIDYGCPAGTPILASEAGVVMHSGWLNGGWGNAVIIRHNSGIATLYAHLGSVSCMDGKRVEQSQIIGYSGSTGNSTGPHLHFEARKIWNDCNSHFDPMSLPLMNFADFAGQIAENPEGTWQNLVQTSQKLKEPEDLQGLVRVVCRDGAKVFNPDWSMRYSGFPQGTKLHFTGKTAQRPGFPQYTYCEVYEEPRKFFVAVHNEDTQILDNAEAEE